MQRYSFVIAILFSGLAWGSDKGSPSTRVPEHESVYKPVTSIIHTMEWILDPAADAVWDSAGYIVTAEGEIDLSPKTDQAWDRVRNGAAIVAESGNLLLMPGRSVGANWDSYAQQLIASGEKALVAAETRNPDALFDAGGLIYQACRGCHSEYMTGAR